jgi:hypothetical protein
VPASPEGEVQASAAGQPDHPSIRAWYFALHKVSNDFQANGLPLFIKEITVHQEELKDDDEGGMELSLNMPAHIFGNEIGNEGCNLIAEADWPHLQLLSIGMHDNS